MKLVLMQFVTLDGVYQGPGSPDEDPSDGFTRGGWMVPHMDQTFISIVAGWLNRCDALLLGRRTYEAFSLAWPQITDPNDPFAERMNTLPKYVASQTLTETRWGPATILNGDIVARVTQLKARPGGELQLHGSARLSRTLLAAGLLDELRLVITPTAWARADGSSRKRAHLSGCASPSTPPHPAASPFSYSNPTAPLRSPPTRGSLQSTPDLQTRYAAPFAPGRFVPYRAGHEGQGTGHHHLAKGVPNGATPVRPHRHQGHQHLPGRHDVRRQDQPRGLVRHHRPRARRGD